MLRTSRSLTPSCARTTDSAAPGDAPLTLMVVVWLNLALAEWSPLRFRVWHHGLTLLGLAAAALPLEWVGPVALATASAPIYGRAKAPP